MQITAQSLAKFRGWMLGRGRTEGTADLYITNLRRCAAEPHSLTHRLIASDLSPNTQHVNKAALRAWAAFSKDEGLAEQLGDIRLPPARRIRTKMPLDEAQWRRFVAHLRTCDMHCEAVRQVILVMALRGFRSGDVLRIRRAEITRALSSGKLIYVGKGRKRIEFAVQPFRGPLEVLMALPAGWDRVHELVSTSAKTASRRIWREARRVAKEASIADLNPHRLRHTFATQFLRKLAGDPNALVKLKQYMHWESIATAARYVDAISTDELDEIGAGLAQGLLD